MLLSQSRFQEIIRIFQFTFPKLHHLIHVDTTLISSRIGTCNKILRVCLLTPMIRIEIFDIFREINYLIVVRGFIKSRLHRTIVYMGLTVLP